MIQIKRETNWVDGIRKYKVILDEKEVGTIPPDGTFEFSVSPGLHKLYLKIDWCRSEKFEFEVKENEILRFHCGGLGDVGFLTILKHITIDRNRYLWIKQVTSNEV